MSFENFLLIDASSPLSVVLGQLSDDGCAWNGFIEEESVALEGVFSALEKIDENALSTAKGFLFCEGPGSILGIRIAAATIRASLSLDNANGKPARPVFIFQSLHLAAHLILRASSQKNFVVAAESRMNAWNILQVRDGIPAKHFQEIKTRETEQLAKEKIFVFSHRRALPTAFSKADVCATGMLLKNDPEVFVSVPGLLRNCDGLPDAVNTSDVDSYVRWIPSRHRGALR